MRKLPFQVDKVLKSISEIFYVIFKPNRCKGTEDKLNFSHSIVYEFFPL